MYERIFAVGRLGNRNVALRLPNSNFNEINRMISDFEMAIGQELDFSFYTYERPDNTVLLKVEEILCKLSKSAS